MSTKISDLTALPNPISGVNAVPISVSGTTYRVNLGDLAELNGSADVKTALAAANKAALSDAVVDGTAIDPSSIGATTPGTVTTTSLRIGTEYRLESDGSQIYAYNPNNGGYYISLVGGNGGISSARFVPVAWTSGSSTGGADLLLWRDDAAGVLAQRNGTNAQESRLYGTYTSSTNYERLSTKYDSGAGAFVIGTEKGSGGGSLRPLEIRVDGTRTAMVWNYGVQFSSGKVLGWTSSSDPTGSAVLGISLIAYGVMGLGAGSGGDFSGQLKLTYLSTAEKTVATLKSAAVAENGTHAYVTDSTLAFTGATIGSAVTGGGSNHTPVVVVNGVWVIG